MRKPSILNVALVCGVVAFCWTLIQGRSQLRRESAGDRAAVRERTRWAAGPLGDAPVEKPMTTSERLEARARSESQKLDEFGWFELARRRAWSGRGDATEAWEQAYTRTAVIEDDMRFGRRHFIRGVAGMQLGFEDEARESLRKSRDWYLARIEDFAQRPRVWTNLGLIATLLKDAEAAREAWTRGEQAAAALAENDDYAALELARFRALLGNTQGAVEALQRAAATYHDAELVELDPDFTAVRESENFEAILEKIRSNPPPMPPQF